MSRGSGGIVQTPEFLLAKEGRAGYEIGGHILAAGLYPDGAAFGMRYDPRRNSELQWLRLLTPTVVCAGWGEYSHLQMVSQFLENSAQNLGDYVGEPYVTLSYLTKIACPFIKQQFEEGIPYSLDILLVDVLNREIRFIDFHGNLAAFKGFGVLGGYPYYVEPTAPDGEPGTEFPRKLAVGYLEKKFNGHEIFHDQKEAVKVITETVMRFDPPSKKELFSIVTYAAGSEKFECAIVERKQNSRKKK